MIELQPSHLVPLLIVTEVEHDMPSGYLRFHSIDKLASEVKRLASLGMDTCKLYVKTRANLKDNYATEGRKKDALMVRAIKEIKNAVPDMRIGTEICACAYHDQGECVLTNNHGVDDTATHELVAELAILHAEAGADIAVAGLTHDGSIRAMRDALDSTGHEDVKVLGSVQLRTSFYAPYRAMMGTEPEAGETFRSHVLPTDTAAVMAKADLHVQEGAEALSMQPALLGVPLLAELKKRHNIPLAAYSVSTEMNLVRGNNTDLWLAQGHEHILCEYFTMLIQAGADQVQTYVAGDLAAWLINR